MAEDRAGDAADDLPLVRRWVSNFQRRKMANSTRWKYSLVGLLVA
jgi:hypothetical protein